MKLGNKIGAGLLLLVVVLIIGVGVTLSYTADCEPPSPTATGEQTAKAYIYRCYGPPEVLELADIDRPEPSGNEVLVRVRAASVNPLDWHFMRGSPYFMRLGSGIGAPTDTRIGVDFAGVVEAVGAEVTRFAVGDHVFGGRTGAFGEYIVVGEDGAIAHMPEGASFEQAAALPIAAITALQALRDKGQLREKQKVLINGASGGVGTFAVQLARAFGAEVHGVCSTRNVDLVRSLGASRVFDYKKESYIDSGESYDLIIDMVGNHSLLANRRVMAPDGKMIVVGGPKGNWIAPLKRPIGAVLLSPFVGQHFEMILARLRQDDLRELAQMVEDGSLSPVVGRRFTFSEVPDAIRHSEEGHARGKIIVTID